MLQVVAAQEALHHIGAVQAVDAVGAEDAALPHRALRAALRIKPPPLKVALDLVPQ